ncbi:MAG: thioesterase [Hyphomicrobiaceae bacterium]|nr:MAG: thioesterase [Hyphomicrobiaceae bacterium]
MCEIGRVPVTDESQFDAEPLFLQRVTVRPEWLNASGHLRAAQYIVLFDLAIEGFLERIGLSAGRDATAAPFLLEMHTCYQKELREGETVRIEVQALAFAEKRVHLIMFMRTEAGEIAATTELAIANVALTKRQTEPWTPSQRETLARLMEAHGGLPVPPQAGRAIARPNR